MIGEARMYATGVCPFCVQAEKPLNSAGRRDRRCALILTRPAPEMMKRTGRRTVPKSIRETHVGGFEDPPLEHAGELEPCFEPGFQTIQS
jgi:glutaredoxin 3